MISLLKSEALTLPKSLENMKLNDQRAFVKFKREMFTNYNLLNPCLKPLMLLLRTTLWADSRASMVDILASLRASNVHI